MRHDTGESPKIRRRAALAAVAVASTAMALSGCESLMVMTGARMRLDGVPLQALAASMPGNGGISPGAVARLSVVATTTDGRTLASAGSGDGKVLLDSYRYDGSVVMVDKDGVVSLPADPHLSEGRTPHVRITAIGQPTPVADLDIPVRYDVAYAATYTGSDGMSGADGVDGRAGSPGSMGSFDPNSPSTGSDGGNGSSGSDGLDGFGGGDGPAVDVTIVKAPGAHPLLHVRANESGRHHDYIVDPEGGSLAITVSAGHGGAGGHGGRGGSGGAGGSGGSGSGMAGSSGSDGRAGQAGFEGAAGSISVTVDPAAAPWLDSFHVVNVAGPAPVVTIVPVAAPW